MQKGFFPTYFWEPGAVLNGRCAMMAFSIFARRFLPYLVRQSASHELQPRTRAAMNSVPADGRGLNFNGLHLKIVRTQKTLFFSFALKHAWEEYQISYFVWWKGWYNQIMQYRPLLQKCRLTLLSLALISSNNLSNI